MSSKNEVYNSKSQMGPSGKGTGQEKQSPQDQGKLSHEPRFTSMGKGSRSGSGVNSGG